MSASDIPNAGREQFEVRRSHEVKAQQEAFAKFAQALMQDIALRKWCVEQASAMLSNAGPSYSVQVDDLWRRIHDFVTSPVNQKLPDPPS